MSKTTSNTPEPIPQHIREWMLSLGYVHANEVADATSTVDRTRARWKTLKPIFFGNQPWYQLADIKRHLDERAAINASAGDDDKVVAL